MRWLLALFFAFCTAHSPAGWTRSELANAAIASAHPLASQAGKEILDHGGNAFDAAVAVAAALAVVEPYSSGLGGGGFFLLHRAHDGRDVVLDARETAPRDVRDELYAGHPKASLEGGLAAAIPGLPAGLDRLARRYGCLPLKATLAPAIRLAEQGFPVDARFRTMALLRHTLLQADTVAAGQFLSGGVVPELGAILRQPALAATLRILATRGGAGFYRGPLARELVRSVRAAGGVWRSTDLQRYRVVERTPLVFDYRGLRITTTPPPSAGGVVLAEALNILARYELPTLDAGTRMHLTVEAMRRAYQDRGVLGDPEFVSNPVTRLMSPPYAAQRAQSISLGNATASADLGAASVPRQGDHTTHFSIVDRAGNRVAATLTINTPFGSGVVAGSTGVLLNNEMDDFSIGNTSNVYGLVASRANRLAPGKRPLSSMTPTFVEDSRGVLVLGTPGGSRIMSMVLLGILTYAAQPSVDLTALVAAPRFHHQYLPDRIEIEPDGFAQGVLDDLQLKGHVVSPARQSWGNMQAVWVDKKTGKAVAASDPRGQGSGLAWY